VFLRVRSVPLFFGVSLGEFSSSFPPFLINVGGYGGF